MLTRTLSSPLLFGIFTTLHIDGQPTQTLQYTFGHVEKFQFVPVATKVLNLVHNSQTLYQEFSFTAIAPQEDRKVTEDALDKTITKVLEDRYLDTMKEMTSMLQTLLQLENKAATLRAAS